LPPRR